MASAHRQFKLAIWGLALGYFIFYAPYVAFIKVTVGGLWPGVSGTVSGFRLLPGVVISTAVVLPIIVSLMGWWKYAGRRRVLGLSVPFPRPLIILSGFGTAIIIGTTTLIFTYPGVSIVFALVLMRGGVLLMSPVVDKIFKRRVRWFSWVAFVVTMPAVLIALADVHNYSLPLVTAAIIIAYLAGYTLRLPCATKLAKSVDRATTYGYFVEELMAAMVFLVAIPAALALVGRGEMMMELRSGFTEFFTSGVTLPALIIGAFYACLYCFGTLIYLDCRENTYCIPLNRGASLLAGFFASYVLAIFFGQKPPSTAQLAGSGLLVAALLFLSPFHHVMERAFGRLKGSLEGAGNRAKVGEAQRVFLFVCSGNTCRSPMAAAIGNALIAARMKIPFDALETVNAQALSAGVSARVGAPLTEEAQEVLRRMNVPVRSHAARNLTAELADQAEMIFCMTEAQRKAVIELVPEANGKTFCLDPDGDIDDPIGKGLDAYLKCAGHIKRLVSWRLDEAQLSPSF